MVLLARAAIPIFRSVQHLVARLNKEYLQVDFHVSLKRLIEIQKQFFTGIPTPANLLWYT